ncbi:MAG: hypothetical protein IJW19_05130 [Clostridia bacterium]|nr:hypothetical protein [Clostridia bacterium]
MDKRLKLSYNEKLIISERYDGCCAYCGRKAKKAINLYIDHVQRFDEKEGEIHPGNLLPVCHVCLKAKGTMSLDGFRAYLGGLREQLRQNNTYMLARIYGLIFEMTTPVEFYFEMVERKKKEGQSKD